MGVLVSAFASGLLFGVGLILSGMADPAIVLGFFDVAGSWNPTLAFVMAGGLATTFVGYRLVLKRKAPLCAEAFQLPTSQVIDGRLVGGAVLFGLGWGVAGYCPGPALVAAMGGFTEAVTFTAAMTAGMAAWSLWSRRVVAVGEPARKAG
ncbi:MAG TPA: DUF6691 family protein [Magnetospirillum sp.]|jgi:uncharacterized membrane protein YedE/YeeE|nr:DUF6691 family protein [Magnetospirillum sp.]